MLEGQYMPTKSNFLFSAMLPRHLEAGVANPNMTAVSTSPKRNYTYTDRQGSTILKAKDG